MGPADPLDLDGAALLGPALDHALAFALVLEAREADWRGLRVLEVSAAFLAASGHDRRQLTGRPPGFLTGEPAALARIRLAGSGHAVQRAELEWRAADGHPTRLETLIIPLDGPHGAGPGGAGRLLLLGCDDAAGRRHRQEDAATRALLASVFRLVDAAVVIVREDGRIVTANPACTRLTGHQPADLADHPFTDFLDAAEAGAALAAHARRSGAAGDRITRIRRADGTILRAHATSARFAQARMDQPGMDQVGSFRIVTLTPAPDASATDAAIRTMLDRLPRGSVLVAGRIRLIGLEEVKARFGAGWAAVAERALDTAEHILARRLDPRDLYSRTDDQGFVICFTSATGQAEAGFRAEVIAREIRHRLIGGDDAAGPCTVTALVQTLAVDGPDVVSAAAVAAAVDRRGVALAAQARRDLAEALATEAPEREGLLDAEGRPVPIAWIAPPAAVLARIEAACALHPPDEAEFAALDGLDLRLACRCIRDDLARLVSATCLVGVPYEQLANWRRAARLLEACHALPAPVRSRLVMMLQDLPPGIPGARIVEIAHSLRPVCRGIGAQIDDVSRLPPELLHGGAVVAIRAADLLRAPRRREFVARVHAHHARALARAAAPEDMPALRELGLDFLTLRQA